LFGDLDDPKSKISKRISSTRAQPLSPQLGTKPKVYYANMTFVPQFKATEAVTAERQTGKIFRSIAEGASV